MGRIFEVAAAYFDEKGWPFTIVDGPEVEDAGSNESSRVLGMSFEGRRGSWTCYARIEEDLDQFVFYSICPVISPASRCTAVAELLTRANFDLLVGNFELSFADGEIRFKTSVDVAGDRLTTALIGNLVFANLAMLDRYLPGIRSVIDGTQSPTDAVESAEAGTES